MEIKTLTRKVTQDNFATENVDILQNNLLGFYDDNGEYCITPQIMEELVSLPKTKKNSFHNSLFCVGNLLGFGEIAFELEYDKNLNDNDCAKATLYILEEVDKINGYLQNTIKTKVGEFENKVENFIEASYDYFHVSLDTSTDVSGEEGMERSLLDDIDSQDSFILAKKQYTLQLDKLSNEKCLDAYGKYFTYRYSALTKMNNAFGEAVIELFETEYARIEKFFLKDKNYKMLNELLDKCIEEISGTSENYIAQEKEFNDIIASAMENFSDSIKALHDKLGNKALNMLDKEDRAKMQDIIEAEENHNKHNDNVMNVNAIENTQTEEVEDQTLTQEEELEEVLEAEAQSEEEAQSEADILENLFMAMIEEEQSSKEQVQAAEITQEKQQEKPTNELPEQNKENLEPKNLFDENFDTKSYLENKILDTNRTNLYDESMIETPEVDAVSSLHASVGRLSALTSKTEGENIEPQIVDTPHEIVTEEPKELTTDDFVHDEVASYLNDNYQAEIPEEKKEEVKAKPRSFEQLFSYLNEQNKIKKDEIALRNQRNRVIHEQTQDNTMNQ